MKKSVLIVFLFCLAIRLYGAEDDSLGIIQAWELTGDFTAVSPVEVDTSLVNFQVFYPNYIESKSNSFLGNLGTPTISNIFADRKYEQDAFFLNYYMPYFFTPEKAKYYNTKKPFSMLTYTNGGSTDTREESFEAFLTQNLNPKLNFSLGYHTTPSKGAYQYQQVKKNSFKGTVNYTGERYVLHGSVNMNYYKANENGGIIDSVFAQQEYEFTKSIPTRIKGGSGPMYDSYARNYIRYHDILLSQRLKLFTLASKADTTEPEKKRNVAEPILTYVIRGGKASKFYGHQNPYASGLYDHYYFNYDKTNDTLTDFWLVNSARLEFKTTFRGKVQLGIYGSIANEYNKYWYFSEWDSTYTQGDTTLTIFTTAADDTLKGVNLEHNLSSTYFTAGFYGKFWKRVQTSFNGKVYFLGYKTGQTEWKGMLNTEITLFKKDFFFDVAAEFKNKVPGYLFQNYYSNHFIWTGSEQNLNSEIWTNLSGKISAPSNNFEITANYYLISNLIYFNEDVIPVNHDDPINVLSFGVAKTFKLWKLYSINEITYQISENREILAIPSLVVYNSTFLNHTFNFSSTGGKLEAMLGFDFYYLTNYYGYEYSPALSQFHTQEDIVIGNYPLFDAFINLKLKRVRFFFKLQNFTSRWTAQNYYAAVHYPHSQIVDNNQPVLRFGVSWMFYD